MAALSRPDSRHQGLDAEDVERSPQIVDERRQAELGPDVVESLHQKCALVHPLLDRAEGMFDGLAAESDSRLPRQHFSPETAQSSQYTAPPRIRDCERFQLRLDKLHPSKATFVERADLFHIRFKATAIEPADEVKKEVLHRD